MAKFGVDVTNMSNVGNAFKPVGGVVDQSGAMRTQALTGLVSSVGQMGLEAYQGYQMAQLETGIEAEIDAYMAPKVAEQSALEAGALAKSVDQMWNRFDTTIEEVNPVERQIQGKLKEYKLAKDQGVMTPEEFSSRVLTVTREAINKNPGLMPELKAHAEKVLELSGIASIQKQDQANLKSAQEKLKDRETYLTERSKHHNIYYNPELPLYAREQQVKQAEEAERAHNLWKRQTEYTDDLIKKGTEQEALQYVANNQVLFTTGAGSELVSNINTAIANAGGKAIPTSQITGITDSFFNSYVAAIDPRLRGNQVMKDQIAHVKDITERMGKNLSGLASGEEQQKILESELATLRATSELNLARKVDPATYRVMREMVQADPRLHMDPSYLKTRATVMEAVFNGNTNSKDAQEFVPLNIQDKRYSTLISSAVDASNKIGNFDGFNNFIDGSNKLASSIQSAEKKHIFLNNNIEALAKSDLTGINSGGYSKVNSMIGSYLNDPNYGIPMMFKEADRLKATIDVLPNGNMLFVGNEADKFNSTFANKFNTALKAYANAQGLTTKEAAGTFYKEYFAPHVGAADMMTDTDIGQGVKPKFEQPKAVQALTQTTPSTKPNPNNPLNLTIPGKQGKFQQFESEYQGIEAASNQLDRYFTGKTTGKPLQTVSDIVGTWNNEKEKGSMSKENYVATVVKHSGLSADKPLDLNNPKVKAALIYGMGIAEGHKLDPKKVLNIVTPYKDIYAGTSSWTGPLKDYVIETAKTYGKAISTADELVFGAWRELVVDGLMAEADYRKRVQAKLGTKDTTPKKETSVVPVIFKD